MCTARVINLTAVSPCVCVCVHVSHSLTDSARVCVCLCGGVIFILGSNIINWNHSAVHDNWRRAARGRKTQHKSDVPTPFCSLFVKAPPSEGMSVCVCVCVERSWRKQVIMQRKSSTEVLERRP